MAFGTQRRGLYSLEPRDVEEVVLYNVTHFGTGVRHRSASVSVPLSDAILGLRAAVLIVEAIEHNGLRVVEALPAGEPSEGDHDLIVERRGAHGRGSMEVKLMQIKEAMPNAREREKERMPRRASAGLTAARPV